MSQEMTLFQQKSYLELSRHHHETKKTKISEIVTSKKWG